MKLSIVTITYNNLSGLKRTAVSILSQTWTDFEWIVIDGGSTDGTKEYIMSLERQPDYWCSEKDAGIYDAQNKGIGVSKGEYVCCMNSGDTFCSKNTLKKVFSRRPKSDVVYGDWYRVYPNHKEKCYSPKKIPPYFFWYNNICHQAMFVRTKLLQESGFDLSYHIFADWAKWRQLMCQNCSFEYVPVFICDFEAEMGTCEQDSVLRKKEYKKLADETPKEIQKAMVDLKCDIDVALVGFYPPNNGTMIWRLNFLKIMLSSKGYKTIAITNCTRHGQVLDIISRAKKVILYRPSMDDFGNTVIRFCIDTQKSFIIDIDDALFHNHIKDDGAFMSAKVSQECMTSVYNNIADSYIYADLMTVSTIKIQEMLLKQYGINSIVLPNRIDVSLCREKSYKEHRGVKLLYTSGTPTHLYDLSTIYLDLFSFMKRHPDVTLTILGDSIDEEQILWANDRVSYIKYQDFDKLLDIYAEHDLVLVPLKKNDFNDAKSNIKYIEAGAVGIPVIASDCSEFRNAIHDGVNGFLYNNNFLKKMDYIYEHKDILADIGTRAYKDVVEKHSTQCGLPQELLKWLDSY